MRLLFACVVLVSLLSVGCTQSSSTTPAQSDLETATTAAQAETDTAAATSTDPAPAAEAESPAAAQSAPQASGGLSDVTFEDLKFEMEKTDPFKREMLTPAVEDLVGKRIRIRGYIRPTPFQTGITNFVLVRDNLECCFGPGAWLYDCVLVEMVPGQSTSYTIRPVAVEGIFDVQEFLGPDGKHLAIYHLTADKVE